MALFVTIILSLAIGLAAWLLCAIQRRLGEQSGDAPRQELGERINAILPGLQCGQCGYAGCEPYARAIAKGEASINLCPPGGEEVAARLASALGQTAAVAPAPVQDGIKAGQSHKLAWVRADDCIGCTLCLDACPVDAIVGAEGCLHTVVPERCTGCQLCVAPCPTDCIEMHQAELHVREWEWPWPRRNSDPPLPH